VLGVEPHSSAGYIMGKDGRNSEGVCRVVGVRANGERVLIAGNISGVIADKVLQLIKLDSDFREVFVEPEAEQEIAKKRGK